MLFCKHSVWVSPELSLSSSGVNVDRSLNLTGGSDRLDAVSCKVQGKKKKKRKKQNTNNNKKEGFCAMHLEGPLFNNKGLCSKMISLKAFQRFLIVAAVGCLATG